MAEYEKVALCPVCLEKAWIHDFIPANNIKECANCGYVFDSPRPTLGEITKLYSQDDKYESWFTPATFRYLVKSNLKRLKIISSFSTHRNLFDVGGGCGFLLYLAKKEGYFDDVLGSEISSSAIKIASESFGVPLLHGEIQGLSLTRRFDNVSLFHVLEHVPDCRATILAIREMMNPGGFLYIAVPNDIDRITNIKRKIRNKPILPRIVLRKNKQIHLSHFRVRTLKVLLVSCGFQVVHSGLDPVGIFNTGMRGLVWKVYYMLSKIILLVFRRNVYWATLVVARKT